MAKLTVTRGWPGSGKSTQVQLRIKFSSRPVVRVNRDLIRDELFGYRLLEPWQENLVSISEKAQVKAFLKAGVDVIVDALHLKSKYVRDWAKLAAEMGADFEIWDEFLNVPLEICIQRDAERTGEAHLGEDVIRSIYKRFHKVPPVDLSDLQPVAVKPYYPIPGTPYAYMVDIDGTCTTGPCDRSPYEWMKVGQDKPNWAVIKTVRSLYSAGRLIIFCSGRDAVCREPTMDWMVGVFGRAMMDNSPLLMREEGDMRKDSVVKMELFDKYIRNDYSVIGVYDDRQQVVDMWRSLGLTVFQVDEGDF